MYLNLLFALIAIVAAATWIIEHKKKRTRYIQNSADIPAFIGAAVTSIVLIAAIYGLGTAGMMRDVEILNGKVVSKQPQKVHCRHSYPCNCRTSCSGSGKNQSCSTVCDTCYDHSYDIDWNVDTTIGRWNINTIDRQGLKEPPRWTKTMIGEPVSKEHTYPNYIKASPQSIFNSAAHTLIEFKGKLPAHPGGIYDYWHTHRLVLSGVKLDESEKMKWDSGIAEILKDIGIKRQVNLVVVLTNNTNSLWANALQTEWLNGKKNEAVIVIGTKNYPQIDWVNVFSWSDSDIFNIKLRDDIRNLEKVDRESILRLSYENINKHFIRKSMKNYEYLESEIEPDSWIIILAILLGIAPYGVYLFREKFF